MIGQLPRLLAGGVKSFVGKVSIGNTGTNVFARGSNGDPGRSETFA
ncbi:MAG: DUF3703 domain-containing protein [Cyclobacteriaceae bacterium]|nr:DUF3703 domain-containing protein [Cyclobacteriaceae bacterium]